MKKYLNRPFHSPDFEIATNDSYFIDLLRLKYGRYLTDNAIDNAYKIILTKKSVNDYLFEYPNGKINTNTPLYDIDRIFLNITVYDNSILPLHGAAVERNGFVYIFLAPTATGKTTLVTYLINNGLGYVSEDCILLEKQNFTVYPYDCPIHLRMGGHEVLKEYKIDIDVDIFDDPAGLRYVYTPDNSIKKQLPLGGIYFIERSETENYIVNMKSSESIIELMKSAMTPQQPSGEYVRLISRLSKIGCKRIIYRDMEYVRDIISGE